jgi:hypothetical protein
LTVAIIDALPDLVNYSFSLLQAFEAADGTGTTTKFYMLRDPRGDRSIAATFNGNWYQTFGSDYYPFVPTDATLTENIVTATGIDPRLSQEHGIIFVDSTELSTCFEEFSIAHERSSDGYQISWID